MGTATTASLGALSNLFGKNPLARDAASSGTARNKRAHDAAAVPNTLTTGKNANSDATTLDSNREQAVAQSFDTAVQWSRMREVSVAVKMRQAAARVKNTEDSGDSSDETKQMAFDFFASSRTEESASFTQRTASTADGLEGDRKASYMEASAKISQRFEVSMSISGSALEGFAGASEQLVSSDDLFEKLVSFANKLLGASDDAFNDMLTLLGGNTLDNEQKSFSSLAEDMLNAFMNDLFGGSSPSKNAAAETSGSAGTQLEFSFTMSLEMNAQVSVQRVQQAQQGVIQQSDPIMFDLDGDGFELSNYQHGAQFDITGTGAKATTAFVNGGDAFLALDRDKDGKISSGKELFGDQLGAANGYEELRKLDSNGDNRIDAQDAAYADLKLWRDNGDGVSEDSELISLAKAGIAEISLNYSNTNQLTLGGNRIAQRATFRWANGMEGAAGDAVLNYTV